MGEDSQTSFHVQFNLPLLNSKRNKNSVDEIFIFTHFDMLKYKSKKFNKQIYSYITVLLHIDINIKLEIYIQFIYYIENYF